MHRVIVLLLFRSGFSSLLIFLLSVLLSLEAHGIETGRDHGQKADTSFVSMVDQLKTPAELQEKINEITQQLETGPSRKKILQQLTLLHLRMGWLFTTGDDSRHHYQKAQTYAEQAFSLDPEDFQSCLLRTAAKAKIAGYLLPGDQVQAARELSNELKDLLSRDRTNPDALYFFSWLNFKISQVSSLKKVLASLMFGGLPEDLTFESAVALMEKAIEERPDYPVYHYDLGYFYLSSGEPSRARSLFEKVSTMQANGAEGIVYRNKSRKRLDALGDNKEGSPF